MAYTFTWPTKDPADKLDYSIDFTDLLEADTIASVVWTVPAPLVLEEQTEGEKIATVWISGGTAGSSYGVNCRVNTEGGRIIERTALLQVKDL